MMNLKPVTIPLVNIHTITDPLNSTRNKIVGCELSGGGATNPFGQAPSYPNGCYLEFGHQDGSNPIRYIQYQTNTAGFRGLKLTGNVDSKDTMFLGFFCKDANDTVYEIK